MEKNSCSDPDIKIKSSEKKNYNENIYFKEIIDKKNSQISQIIEELIESKKKSLIKFNFHISNNYYNSSIKKEEEKGKNKITSFFDFMKNLFGFKSSSNKKDEKIENKTKVFFYVPCLNCSNQIHIDEVSNHSQYCLYVKEEILNFELSDSLKAIDFRLIKLKDHLINLIEEEKKSNNSHSKDIHYLTTLFTYIDESIGNFFLIKEINTFNKRSISIFKKINLNLFTLSNLFKGDPYTLILIERTKVLLKEKSKIIKEYLRKDINREKIESSYQDEIKKKINELNSRKEQIIKEHNKIKMEKDFLLRKICNFKHTIDSFHFTTGEDDYFEDSSNNTSSIKQNYNHNSYNEDINSEFDKYQSEKSSNTSVDSSSDNNLVLHFNNNLNEDTSNVEYKAFVYMFLQKKFNKGKTGLHNIDHKSLWEEVKIQNIPKNQWNAFIDSKLLDNKPRLTKTNRLSESHKMKTIKEESL